MSDFRVLVTGGRHYDNALEVQRALDSVVGRFGLPVVIHGGATGADTLADRWARRVGAEVIRRPANWARHGGMAGPLRNAEMLELKPNLVIAFPGGKGTADMMRRARKAGVPVEEWGANNMPNGAA